MQDESDDPTRDARDPSEPADSGSGDNPPRGPSEAQVHANRRNAQRSTGPRTASGKARSAGNSLKHGVYARAGAAIERGPFAENVIEANAFLSGIIDALAPRDSLEQTRAVRIAQLHLVERRLDVLEGWMLNADSALSPIEKVLAGGDFGDAAMACRAFDQIVAEYRARSRPAAARSKKRSDDFNTFGPKTLALFARRDAGAGFTIPGIWDDETEPSDDAGWEAALWAVIDRRFNTLDEVLKWAEAQKAAAMIKAEDVEQLAGKVVAGRVMETLEKCLAMRARTTREIVIQLAMYEALKARREEAQRDT